MNYCRCDQCDCYGIVNREADICDHCAASHYVDKESGSFVDQMNKSWQDMESRMKELEKDVKRLKRELGLK